MNLNFYRLTLICCAAVLIFFLSDVFGQNKPASIENLDSPVSPNSKTTYNDLIDLVFPKTGEETRKSVPLNNIFGEYKDKTYEGKLGSISAESVWVNADGQKRLLLLINLIQDQGELYQWMEMNVAALFDVGGKPRLLDAVDVQADRFAFFSEEQPILRISPKTDAFLIVNHHFNSGDSYLNLSLISVVNNRFKIVLDQIPMLTGDNHCGLNYEEKAFLKLMPNARSQFSNINVNFKHIRHPDGADCDRKVRGYTKNYFYQFAWNEKLKKYSKLKGRK